MKDDQKQHDKSNHAPGAGSDHQHPDTPPDANERFRKQNDDEKKDKDS